MPPKKVKDIVPGHRITKQVTVISVTRTQTQIIITTDDGATGTYEIAQDPAIDAEFTEPEESEEVTEASPVEPDGEPE